MPSQTRWLDDILAAFQRLGGEARLTPTLYDEMRNTRKGPLEAVASDRAPHH